jgi:hypothetical protein
MKGLTSQVLAGTRPTALRVNVKAWAVGAMAEQSCQERVDAKAFKGRGSLQELRHYVDRLDAIEAEMVGLSMLSKTGGLDVYLMLHRRGKTAYVFLRWREVGGAKRHLAWGVMHDRTAGLHSQAGQWIHDVTRQAQRLNDEHLRTRAALGRLRREVLASEQHVFQRGTS